MGKPVLIALILLLNARASETGRWLFEDDPGFLLNSVSADHSLANNGSVATLASGGPHEGQAAEFSGSNFLTAPLHSDWAAEKFTVSCYFRVDAITSATQVLVAHHNNLNDQRSWHLAVTSGGKLRFAKSNDGAGLNTRDIGSVTPGSGYFASATYDSVSGALSLILEKQEPDATPVIDNSTLPAGLYQADAPFSIGASGTSPDGSGWFKGTIDTVSFTPTVNDDPPVVYSEKTDGYKGIWFPLGQRSEYGDKYSGGLATYTVNHSPLSVYRPEVDKTFFTYGGTTAADEGHLLIMASEFCHKTNSVPKPTIVMDKAAANGDAHDNASITVDADGFVWVFVSGRNTSRPGYTFRSTEPYSTDGFTRISPPAGESYTYPQIWHVPGQGFLHFFTIYESGRRNLFFRKSADGIVWEPTQVIARVQGSYQISRTNGSRIATFFNRHPGGNVDARTDVYYVQSDDFGETWTLADGTPVTLPITTTASPARVVDYASQNRLMYNSDINFDSAGNPVLFYLTTANFRPGPDGEPRLYHTARWTGTEWEIRDMPVSATTLSTTTQNYDAGSIWIDEEKWTVIAPTGARPELLDSNPERFWGQGGEIGHWISEDHGATWAKTRDITTASPRNHGFVRRSHHGSGRFQSFWCDGNPEGRTEVHLYFGTSDGTRHWELPYEMDTERAAPVEKNPPYQRWLEQSFNAEQLADPPLIEASADPDLDGGTNFEEYIAATLPFSDSSAPTGNLWSFSVEDAELVIEYAINSEALDVLTTLQWSEDLDEWQIDDGPLSERSRRSEGGLDFITLTRPVPEESPLFYRLKHALDP